MNDFIKYSLQSSANLKLKCIDELLDKINVLIYEIISTYSNNGKVILFGNGGSAADAQHVSGELLGHYKLDRESLPAIALTTDSSVLTCIANDYSFSEVFSRQIDGLGNPEDLVIGITTSGNSENVNKALKKAKDKGIFTVGFTGTSGGKTKDIVDLLINVPSKQTPRIQEAHITIFHIICEAVEKKMEEKKYDLC